MLLIFLCSGCSSSGSLNGEGSLNGGGSLAGMESDKVACENFAAIQETVGAAISLDGSNALAYATSIDNEVLPMASRRLALPLKEMSNTLKNLADASVLDQLRYSEELLTYGDEVATICVEVMLNE